MTCYIPTVPSFTVQKNSSSLDFVGLKRHVQSHGISLTKLKNGDNPSGRQKSIFLLSPSVSLSLSLIQFLLQSYERWIHTLYLIDLLARLSHYVCLRTFPCDLLSPSFSICFLSKETERLVATCKSALRLLSVLIKFGRSKFTGLEWKLENQKLIGISWTQNNMDIAQHCGIYLISIGKASFS